MYFRGSKMFKFVNCHVLLKFILRMLLIILQTLILDSHVQTRNFIPFSSATNTYIHTYIHIYIYTHTYIHTCYSEYIYIYAPTVQLAWLQEHQRRLLIPIHGS